MTRFDPPTSFTTTARRGTSEIGIMNVQHKSLSFANAFIMIFILTVLVMTMVPKTMGSMLLVIYFSKSSLAVVCHFANLAILYAAVVKQPSGKKWRICTFLFGPDHNLDSTLVMHGTFVIVVM